MLKVVKGDLFDAKVDALVNAVNCEGVMNRGIAAEFKRRYPEMFLSYEKFCKSKELKIGGLHAYEFDVNAPKNTLKYIINFPTKDKWRNPSKLSYIIEALPIFKSLCADEKISSAAIPALGCGLGRLPWVKVSNLIRIYCDEMMPEVKVLLYEPMAT